MNSLSNLARISRYPSQPSGARSPKLPRFVWVGLLTTASLVGGWVPGLVTTPTSIAFSSGNAAWAQPKPATAEEISNFVRSALSMEPMRKQAFQEIKTKMGQVPAIRCDVPDGFETLDPSVRGVAIKYCNASKRIVESNGLSVARFNEILVTQRQDAKLRDRIQAETCRISPEVCK